LPTPLWQEPDERSEEGAIGWPERRTIRLPSEHCELVAQDEQLDVFGELAPPSSNKQPQHSREGEVGEGKQHSPMLSWRRRRPPARWNPGFETPQRRRTRSRA